MAVRSPQHPPPVSLRSPLRFYPHSAAERPRRPLTPVQEDVARYCARGWRYDRIAVELRVSPRTVEHYVRSIADLLTWDDDVSPQLRVALWAQSALMAWSSPPPHHIGDSSGVSTDDAAA